MPDYTTTSLAVSGSAPAIPVTTQRWRHVLATVYGRPASAFGATVVLLFLVIAVCGPLIAPYSATQQIATAMRQAPSGQHLFGTDRLGRDVFSRVILGTRDIISLAGLGTVLAVAAGTTFGLFSGYRGGLFDEVLFRFFDSLLAMPALLLALLFLGTIGPSRNSI